MSSAGQIIGGIAGGVIGFIVTGGNPYGAIQGAAIGSSIGGYIDPPPGPDLMGPTIDDKSFQSSAYGIALPHLYGTVALQGNVIYMENNEYRAVVRKEKTGGKGGGPEGSYTTTTYYATFAVALGEAMPGSSIRRIWLGGKLFYSAGTEDFSTINQSLNVIGGFAYYDGSQTEPDSRMESVVGVGRTPSYEGTAYIIFYDLDLTPYGNGLMGAPVKVEISPAGGEQRMYIEGWDLTTKLPENFLAGMVNSARLFSVPQSFLTADSQSFRIKFDSRRALRQYVDLGDGTVGRVGGDSSFDEYWYSTTRQSVPGGFYDISLLKSSSGQTVELGIDYDSYDRVFNKSDTGFYFVARKDTGDLDDGYYLFKNISDRLAIGANNAIAIGSGKICILSSVSDTISIDVYDPDFALIKSFSLSLPDDRNNGVFDTTGCAIDGDLLYFTAGQTVQSNKIRIVKVRLTTEEFFVNDITLPGSWANTVDSAFQHMSARNGVMYLFANCGKAPVELIRTKTLFKILDLPLVTPQPASLMSIAADQILRAGIDEDYFDVSSLDDDVDGYIFSGPGSARGALGPLQVAYLFDFIEIGYALAAVKRGAAPDETVPWYHLNARVHSDAPGVLIKKDYETDSQLPSRYSITHMDIAREYDTNTQYADFPSRRINERNETLPIVMSADRAAQLADVLGNLAWVERHSFVFVLPQIYLGWRAGAVKTVEISPGKTVVLRINDITITADQRLEITAKLAEPSVYQSGAVGAAVLPPPETLPYVSVSVLFLMDLPMILYSTDVPGFVAAMYGAGAWPGGILFRSVDNGQSYSGIQAFAGQGTVAEAINALSANDGFIIDRASELNVQVLAGDFSAITEAQMMTGQNYCAYGADGRWEIIRYASSVLESDGTRTLSTFIRGLRGTEWATGLHEPGDYIVLLDDEDNAFIGSDLSQLSMNRLFKPVTVGQNLDDAEELEFAWQGVNLKPLSPVLPVGEIVSDDWIVSWTPRTRYSNSFWYTGNQPQNESAMLWDVDVMDGADVVRTLSSATPSVTYTEAQQIEDFGAAQTTITLNIYQRSERVGRGYPLEVTF